MKRKNTKKILKNEQLIKIIITSILLVGTVIIFVINNNKHRYLDILKPSCLVTTLEELEQCKEENRYIKVETTTIYSTDYVYSIENNPTALFIDIDLEGKSLIAVIEKEKGESLLEGNAPYIIEGHLEYNEDIKMEEGKEQILEDYLSQANSEEDKVKIEESFIDGILNEYRYPTGNIYFALTIYLVVVLILSTVLINNIYNFLTVKKIK